MSHPTDPRGGRAPSLPPLVDGQLIATPAGAAVIAVQRVNADAFRLSVHDGYTGAEVPELSLVFAAERAARHAVRVAAALFRSGWAVEQVKDLVTVFAGTPDPAGSARAANRRRGQARPPRPSVRPEGGPDMQINDLKATADEWYEYPGSAAEGKPPYWVARHGTTVTSQIDGYDLETVDRPTVARARAEFAEGTCDPDGPGGPQPGDTIRVFYGEAEGQWLTVESATAQPKDGGWTEFTVTGHRSGRPLTLTNVQLRLIADCDEHATSVEDYELHPVQMRALAAVLVEMADQVDKIRARSGHGSADPVQGR